MPRTRAPLFVIAASLAISASLGIVAACGGNAASDSTTATARETLDAANVSITLHDGLGAKVGEGAGVLIAPRLVLTAAHLVAGKSKWTVTSADGKVTATGTRALTKDWMIYNSLKSHPRKRDVAVIYLDKPINLPSYPKIAKSREASGTSAFRVTNAGGSFATHAATLARVSSSPYAYVTDIPKSETLTTGGAVMNAKGEITGVVMGRGMTTGKLYVAGLSSVSSWVSPKLICGGAKSADNVGIATYGGSSGESSSSSSSGGSSSGGAKPCDGGADHNHTKDCPTKRDGGSSSGGSDGGGGGEGPCDDGNCSGDCTGGGDGGSSSSSSSSSGGNDTTSGGVGTTSSSSSSSSSSGGGGDEGDGGSNETTSGGVGTTSSSGGAGDGADEVPDECTGPDDDPEVCPPEANGCEGPSCGGGGMDPTMDYGDCGCAAPVNGGRLPSLR